MADWVDLDGNLLIANDSFDGVKVVDGKITLTDKLGIGLRLLNKFCYEECFRGIATPEHPSL